MAKSSVGVTALVLVLALCCVSRGLAQAVRTPKVLAEGQLDTSSVESIIAAIIKPGMTQQEKALAVFDFLRTHVYHWPATREAPDLEDFHAGVIYDPIKLVNVYGYGYCFQNRSALEALWQAAGLEARSAGITGHSIAEAYFDGMYHFIDADQHGYCYLPDGKTIASIDQISRDPFGLLLNQPKPTTPYFPSTRDPKVPYESKYICASYFASRENNFYQHDKTVLGHRIDVTLVPGMRYVRKFQGDGRWNVQPKFQEIECRLEYMNPAVGPKDFLTDKTYGNGYLLWQPDLTSATREYQAGVWQDQNIVQTERGLACKTAGVPAWTVLRVRLPYVIAGWPTEWAEYGKPAGAAVVAAAFSREDAGDTQAISVSVDRGRTWTQVWQNDRTGASRVVVDFSPLVASRYEYLIRFELLAQRRAAASRLEQVALSTAFQCVPMTLPAVREGETRMTFSLGDQTETYELYPDVLTAEGFLSDVQQIENIVWAPGAIRTRPGRSGQIVYCLEPPKPGVVKSFSAAGSIRDDADLLDYRDTFRIEYAENEPKDWKVLYEFDRPGPEVSHSQSEAFGQAACSPGTRRVYVRYALHTETCIAIQRMRMRFYWQPEGEQEPMTPVRVDHAWTENGAARRFETTVASAPTQYVVKAGQGVVNQSITMEPVRDARCRWRENDPPVVRPPPPKYPEPDYRDEARRLLRAIDADPKTGLPQAVKSRVEWVAKTAREALPMFETTYPLPYVTDFGRATLAAAGRVAGLVDPTYTGPPPNPNPGVALSAPPNLGFRVAAAADVDALVAALDKSALPADRVVLAAALVLLNDPRGKTPLAEEARKVPANIAVEPIVLLLKAGDAYGAEGVRTIMTGPDKYAKLQLVHGLRDVGPRPVPDEVLVGLSDASRYVRLAVLELVRASPSPAAHAAVERMSRTDPLDWLRVEAAGALKP
jgi:hypothetical protein